MTTRYQKEHYEDVARVLSYHITAAGMDDERERMQWLAWVAESFIDLFAADNPPACQAFHGPGHDSSCKLTGGFNREQFLIACGLKEE